MYSTVFLMGLDSKKVPNAKLCTGSLGFFSPPGMESKLMQIGANRERTPDGVCNPGPHGRLRGYLQAPDRSFVCLMFRGSLAQCGCD